MTTQEQGLSIWSIDSVCPADRPTRALVVALVAGALATVATSRAQADR